MSPLPPSSRDWHPWAALLLLAVSGRLALLTVRSHELTQDRDAYLGLAENLQSGRGLATPGSDSPTAYRPPLYPLVLALAPRGTTAAGVATVNVLSAVAAVLATAAFARALGLPAASTFTAAALVAVDPLLVRYAAQPMTESLCTCLVTVWLWQFVGCCRSHSVKRAAGAGVWFGLCALCRPTLWSAVPVLVGWGVWSWHRVERPDSGRCHGDQRAANGSTSSPLSILLASVLGCAVVVLPWVLRNQQALGAPVLTTTHGGYTLLLGNNPEFYAAVRRDPWAQDWDGPHAAGQAQWQQSLQAELRRSGVSGEIETDAWMNAEAWRHIRGDLAGFLRAAWLRQLRLWNIVPLGDARTGWPPAVLWSVGAFYLVLWLLAAVGAYDVIATRAALWMPGGLVILSFMVVHTFYWSNARMRAPLVPIVALLAVRGGMRLRSNTTACGATGSGSSAAA